VNCFAVVGVQVNVCQAGYDTNELSTFFVLCVQANVCQAGYERNGGSLVVTTELFISRVDNSVLGEYGFVPFAEIIEGFERM
jgi:hypothetical protein